MHAAGEFVGERGVDGAMAVDAALPLEGLAHDIHSEMRLAAGPVTGMPLVQMRFIHDPQRLRGESLVQLLCDEVRCSHAGRKQFFTAKVNALAPTSRSARRNRWRLAVTTHFSA
jgi:hypothetical protein